MPQSILEKPIDVGWNENGGRKNSMLCFCSKEHEYLKKTITYNWKTEREKIPNIVEPESVNVSG